MRTINKDKTEEIKEKDEILWNMRRRGRQWCQNSWRRNDDSWHVKIIRRSLRWWNEMQILNHLARHYNFLTKHHNLIYFQSYHTNVSISRGDFSGTWFFHFHHRNFYITDTLYTFLFYILSLFKKYIFCIDLLIIASHKLTYYSLHHIFLKKHCFISSLSIYI